MTVFLTIGVIGIVLLLLALIADDFFDGMFEALGGGEWFTGAALAGFLGGVGFVGAGVLAVTANTCPAVAIGVVAGLALGFAVGWVTLALRNASSGSTPTTASLVGLTGTVVNDIPEQGFGVLSVVNAGHLTRLNARSIEALPSGTPVTVTDVLSPTSVKVVPTYR